jgi:hypothetical protein
MEQMRVGRKRPRAAAAAAATDSEVGHMPGGINQAIATPSGLLTCMC